MPYPLQRFFKCAAFLKVAVAVFIGLGLSSCDFEFPAGKKTGRNPDARLLGRWYCQSESGKTIGFENYHVLKGASENELLVVVDDKLEFIATCIDAPIPGLLQLQLARMADENGKWEAAPNATYVIAATRVEGRELMLKRLKPVDEKAIKNESQMAAYVAEATKSLDWATAPADDDNASLWKTRRLERSSEAQERIRKLQAKIADNEAKIKALDEEADALENRTAVSASKLGGGVWPPADLIFRDAADWHQKMCGAPVLARPAFLEKVKKVRLEIEITQDLRQQFDQDEIWLMAVKAARSEGFEIDPHAGVNLVMTIRDHSADNVVKENGIEISRVPFSVLIFEARFNVPARVQRGGEFYHIEASPASAMVFLDQVGRYDGASVRKHFPSAFARCMATMRAEGLHWEGDEAWIAAVGPLEKAGERYLAYKNSRRAKRDEFARSYSGLDRMAGVFVELENRASELIDKSELEKAWLGALEEAGMRRQERGAPALRYWLFANYHGPKDVAGALFTSEHRDHWTFVEHFVLSDTNAVYDLNGELFRGLVDLSFDVEAGFALKADMPEALGRQIAGTAKAFVNNARSLR